MKKFNGFKITMTLFLALMVFNNSSYAANIQWDGGGDATSWSDPLNWAGDIIPGSGDQAIFPTPVDTTIIGTATSAVQGIQVWNGANVILDLDVTVNATNSNTVKLFNSTLTVKSGRTLTVTVTGANAGAITFTQPNGAFNVESGATVNLTGWRGVNTFATSTSATLNNSGTINIAATNSAMQPNNATQLTIVNHPCGKIIVSNGLIKVWSNAAVSTITNNGLLTSTHGTGAAVSVSGSNIATNNAFYTSMNGSFAAGNGTKVDNGINLNSSDTLVDATNTCSVAAMGILAAHSWYSDTTTMTIVGSNDNLGALNFAANAFPSSGTQTIYSCYGADVAITVQNIDGTCITPDSIDVTFLVGTSNLTSVDPAGLFLAGGGTFGNPGDNPMTDANGDGIWEITVKLEEGFTTDYTFTNGNCPNYSCKENLTGLSCAVAPFNDRHFAGAWSDTTVLTCFGTCNTDTICPAPPVLVDLTFTVDMSQYSGSFTTAYVFGSFNGWNATGNPMTDQGNGLWSGTITVNENDSIEYKFLADGTAETFAGGESCTKTTGGFTNRFLTYGNTNMTLSTVCWENCSACYTPNIQWDGGGDGISWNDGLNWVGDLVPNNTEQAIFPTSVGTLTVSGTANPVAGVQVWDSVHVTLDLDVVVNATTANSVKLFTASKLTVKSGRTLNSTLTGVNDGAIIFTQPNGELNVQNGATVNLTSWRGISSYAAATSATINNYGTISISGSNAGIQPNNATSMTVINHPCGAIYNSGNVIKIWSNAAVSSLTNNGLVSSTAGTGAAVSVSGNNIAVNNAFYTSMNGVFAAGSGNKTDNGINLNSNDTLIDAASSCSIANMGILTAYNWYSDASAMTMVGSNDTLGALSFSMNAFANAGTQTIYTCYGADVAITVQNVDGACVMPVIPDTIDLTFTVDMSQYGSSFTTAYIFGSFNGWNSTGDSLTDQGNGLWSGTISVVENDSLEYKFMADGTAETFVGGEPCTKTTSGFTNRFLAYGDVNMALDTVCWNSCTACSALPDSVDITFMVDMSQADSIASDGVFVAGDFNNWSDTPMMDMNGDSTYEVTLTVAELSTYEFKFKNGASGWENIDMTWDSTCVVPGGFGNRFVMVDSANVTLTNYCFNTCVTCATVVPTKFVPLTAEFEMMPNPANTTVRLAFNNEFVSTERTIFLHNAMGQLVFNTVINNSDAYLLNTTNFPSGMYFITVQTNEGILTKSLVISH